MSPYATAILAILQSRPVFREDVALKEEKRAQLEVIAPAIAKASHGDKFVAALLIAIGDAETHWSLRVWRNDCRVRIGECDRGLARSFWQTHRSSFVTAEQWETMGTPTEAGTLAAAQVAASLLQYGIHMCGRDAACCLNMYAGQRPGKQWRGLDARLNLFNSSISKL